MTAEPSPDVMLRAFRRYAAAFGTLPPLIAWHGTDADLLPLLNAAILERRHLEVADLTRAQIAPLAPDPSS